MNSHEEKADTFLSGVNRLTAILLLLAPLRWPYSYYIFLRCFVLIAVLLHIAASLSRRRAKALAVFVPIGILFNPITPIFLSKGTWVFLDLFAALFFIMGYEELEIAKPKQDS